MAFWRAVDWGRPWLAPYRDDGLALCRRLEAGEHTAHALTGLQAGRAGGPVFVDAALANDAEAYEAFIARTGAVPTRHNLHDLFNGLVWLRLPALKRHLNRLHAAQIAHDGIGPARGPLRDALTLFDENAAWWQAPPACIDALRAHDWHALFVAQRAAWQGAPPPVLFGHALLEKLVRPRKPITAHLWCVRLGVEPEAWLVDALSPERLTGESRLVLPVLGVPGWWAPNEDPAFYADADVFRPRRHNPPREASQTAAGTSVRKDVLEEGPDCAGRRSS